MKGSLLFAAVFLAAVAAPASAQRSLLEGELCAPNEALVVGCSSPSVSMALCAEKESKKPTMSLRLKDDAEGTSPDLLNWVESPSKAFLSTRLDGQAVLRSLAFPVRGPLPAIPKNVGSASGLRPEISIWETRRDGSGELSVDAHFVIPRDLATCRGTIEGSLARVDGRVEVRPYQPPAVERSEQAAEAIGGAAGPVHLQIQLRYRLVEVTLGASDGFLAPELGNGKYLTATYEAASCHAADEGLIDEVADVATGIKIAYPSRKEDNLAVRVSSPAGCAQAWSKDFFVSREGMIAHGIRRLEPSDGGKVPGEAGE